MVDLLRNEAAFGDSDAGAGAVAAAGTTEKYILQALAPLASLTGLQRKPTLFQKRQLLQPLAPLARLHWKPTLLQT